MDEHGAFLLGVMDYVTRHPEVSAHISDFVQKGIETARRADLERAADMEVALTVALAKRFKNPEELILSKLKKWQHKSAVNWDTTIQRLEGASK